MKVLSCAETARGGCARERTLGLNVLNSQSHERDPSFSLVYLPRDMQTVLTRHKAKSGWRPIAAEDLDLQRMTYD